MLTDMQLRALNPAEKIYKIAGNRIEAVIAPNPK